MSETTGTESVAPVEGTEAAGAAAGTAPASQAPTGKTDGALDLTKAQVRELQAADMDAMVSMKVDGKTVRMSVKDALKQAELGAGAQRRMQEAAQERKEAQRLRQLAKTDPDKYLQEIGEDPDAYAERRLVSKYERMAMTPEQKKAYETEQKLKSYEAQENATKNQMLGELKKIVGEIPEGYDKKSKEEIYHDVQRARQAYQEQTQAVEKEFLEAWKETGLPRQPMFGQWTASLMHASQVQKNQGEREQALQAKEAAAIVKESFMSAVKEITGQMDAQALHQLLGPENMKRLREFDVQRVTGKKAPAFEQTRPGDKPASTSSKNTKTVNESGWNAVFRSIK